MKHGNVSQTVYRRSVLKQLDVNKEEVLLSPAQEETCYGIRVNGECQQIASSVSLYGNEKDLCIYGLAQSVNNVSTRGAKAKGVSFHIMLPDYSYESRIKAMIAAAKEAAAERGIQILEVNVQIVPHIQTTIVHTTAIGEVKNLVKSADAKADQDLVMIGYMGLEGTFRILHAKEQQLKERFIPSFLGKIDTYKDMIFAEDAIEVAAENGASAMHQVTEGGIMAALWNLAEGADIGLSVDMRKIAVKQETIELCECFHLNPYQMTSAGCILVVTPKGEELVDVLSANGVKATVIGRTTSDNERVMVTEGEKRYLDRPAPDELIKILVDDK